MASFRKRGDNWFYRIIGPDGRQTERKGCSDRRATEQMAAAAEAEAARIRGGFVTVAEVQTKKHAARPMADHLAEYRDDQLNRGLGPKHADEVNVRLTRLLSLAKVPTLAALAPERVQRAIAALQGQGLSAQTTKTYAATLKAFVGWCQRTGRLGRNPVPGLKGGNPALDRRGRWLPTKFNVC